MSLPPFLTAFFVSLVMTPLVMRWAWKFGLVDDPKRAHPAILHQKPLPRAGGVAMFAGFVAAALIFAPKNSFLAGILLGGFITVLSGTLDDRFELSPLLRLLVVQPLVAGVAIASGVGIPGHVITNPLGGFFHLDWFTLNFTLWAPQQLVLPSDFLVLLWIILVMNMVNWSKGVSQLPGVSVIAFLTLAGVALKYQAGNPLQLTTALLAVISAGAVLAFVPFNFPPERMLPGFGASTWIGFNLAVLSVLSGGKLAAALLVLAIPAADMAITIARRVFSGQNPWQGDRQHVYHLLYDSGLTKRQIIFSYWVLTAVLGFLALSLTGGSKLFAITLVGLVVLLGFVVLTRLLTRRRREGSLKVQG